MVEALLDSATLVDVLRGYPPAVEWLGRQQRLGVTPVVWFEIIEGAKSLAAQRSALRLLRLFERIELASEDYTWAIRQALRFRLSHNVGANDCLIAAVAVRLQVPLYTRNLKHFRVLLGERAQQPY